MPCNPRPFLRSMVDHLLKNGEPTSDEFKGNLYVVLVQTYGQLAHIVLETEKHALVPTLQTVHPCLAMIELVNEVGNPVCKRSDYKSYLYQVMVLAYGEVAVIDLVHEWDRLYATLSDEIKASLF